MSNLSTWFQQKCCGGDGPTDYYNSFWFITNTDRGTRSFVPTSCCHQTQSARAWSINPIDPLCTIYHYQAKVFNDVVYTEVCFDVYVQICMHLLNNVSKICTLPVFEKFHFSDNTYVFSGMWAETLSLVFRPDNHIRCCRLQFRCTSGIVLSHLNNRCISKARFCLSHVL